MKTKTLLIILGILGFIFVYFQICYIFVGNVIEKRTKNLALKYVLDYYPKDTSVSYLTSRVKQDNIIYVYYQTLNNDQKDYLRFSFIINDQHYQLLEVDQNVSGSIIAQYN